MKIIPTNKYKTSVLFYDDDRQFLNFLKDNLITDKYNFYFVDNIQDFNRLITQNATIKNSIPSISNRLDYEINDYANHDAVDFDLSKFSEIRNLNEKFLEISVIVIDNELGNQNGIDLCTQIGSEFKKILLTGECDKTSAIQALNNKNINLFIEKFDFNNINDNLIDQILKHLESITDTFFIEKNFYSTPLLSNKIFKKIFVETIKKYNICEYYLLEKDMFLLIDNKFSEFYFKCWQEHEFENYYQLNFDEFNEINNIKLKNEVFNKRIPIGEYFIESLQLDNFYYCITDPNIHKGYLCRI